MLLNDWLHLYPIIGMASLTSVLLLLCSFARTKPRSTEIIQRPKSLTQVQPANLLTNEDSSKVFRGCGSLASGSSGHSVSVDTLSAAPVVAITVQEEPKLKYQAKTVLQAVNVIKNKPKVELKKSKESIKVQPKRMLLSPKKFKSDSINIGVKSFPSLKSIISISDSEPEISSIRTIYKSKNKKKIKSIISAFDLEKSKDSED